jgi:hypothetical protein
VREGGAYPAALAAATRRNASARVPRVKRFDLRGSAAVGWPRRPRRVPGCRSFP